MKCIHKYLRTVAGLLLVIQLFAGCTDDPVPSVYNPDGGGLPSPTILSVDPESLATGGVTEVTISGTNFSTDSLGNMVYFGAAKGTIVSQTSTEISVIPPLVTGDALVIQVVVAGAFAIAQYGPYELEGVGLEYGGFGDLDEVYSVALDNSENLFAHVRTSGVSRVILIPASGVRDTLTTTSFPKASQIHVGPGGDLYLQQSSSTNMFKLPAGGNAVKSFAILPTGTKASFFDFDSLGNIFLAGSAGGLYAIHADATYQLAGSYGLFDVKSIRVYGGYVYVAALYNGTDTTVAESGIWRNQILDASGSVGPAELVFDWANATDFSASLFFSITFSSDGDMYVGTDNVDPILIVKHDGSLETLYPGLLEPTAGSLVWGSGTYLYQNRTNANVMIRRLIRVDSGKTSAPYYGRM